MTESPPDFTLIQENKTTKGMKDFIIIKRSWNLKLAGEVQSVVLASDLYEKIAPEPRPWEAWADYHIVHSLAGINEVDWVKVIAQEDGASRTDYLLTLDFAMKIYMHDMIYKNDLTEARVRYQLEPDRGSIQFKGLKRKGFMLSAEGKDD